ncbi:uncharacterized protein LAESUDRAFT_744415 [Laetiporus sulphureus 93-53]|uniref:Microbial-type PARG catalytic domain-containing protein n=1 Tax=Laetiporus sulphureus 93-53 TaxID=1314785 RepID=A0A165D0W6_9APHY|nr:uncharacterized protein LAESUDRAFT_744415 [Laetiporus sulphureus 93-53]KZT03911.1 hypothetical protein LAESUDRAFT_744415 [Laetiporus sulphureus 93-53]
MCANHREKSIDSISGRRDERQERLKAIAEETLAAIDQGSYHLNDTVYDLNADVISSKKGTQYYAPDSLLYAWKSMASTPQSSAAVEISLLEISTLEGARLLSTFSDPPPRVGVLNFASATSPGGGFKNGAQAQEESIARSSTLYLTLVTPLSQTFYALHLRDGRDGYYSHAMLYSPGVIVFRDDAGGWVEPYRMDVLTSCAVNAGVVRRESQGDDDGSVTETKIARIMRERMARILFLFERQGIKNVVLGSFGTGVFKNDVSLVANVWADLLLQDGGRFKGSFERVVFAILGRSTFEEFERVFAERESLSSAAGKSEN